MLTRVMCTCWLGNTFLLGERTEKEGWTGNALKVFAHFECVPAWEMLSLVREMRSNDIRDVKAIAWGMTA